MLVPRSMFHLHELADPDSDRYALGGVRIVRTAEGKPQAAATDGRRMLVAQWEEDPADEYPTMAGCDPSPNGNTLAVSIPREVCRKAVKLAEAAMFTSNFARMRRLPPDLRPVAISIGLPRWYNRARELRLAPTRESLPWPQDRFDPFYNSLLAQLDPAALYGELGDNAVLLCWESPNIWCHRRRVAEWFEEALGVVVPEFGFDRSAVLAYKDMPPKPPAKRRIRPRKAAGAGLTARRRSQ